MANNLDEKEINDGPDTREEDNGRIARKAAESTHKDEKPKKELEAAKKELEKMRKEKEELEKNLKQAQEEASNLKDQLMRSVAEFDNFKKRTQKEKEQMYSDATSVAAAKLLPALDNLERALAAEAFGAELQKGVEMTYKQLTDAFAALGIACMNLEPGCPFDPQLHNAVMHIEDENLPENCIAEVLQKGYTIGDKVIRHAMVKAAN